MAVALKRSRAVSRTRGIDHVTILTRDAQAAKRLYARALRPLGFSIVFDWPDGGRAYLAVADEPSSVWLVESRSAGHSHVTLAAADRSAVDAFFAAATASGAAAVSPPSLRPDLTPFTYAAEVRDPDGNAIEAICHRPDDAVGMTVGRAA